MPTRTTILIVVLTLFTTGLVVYSLILDARKPTAVTVSTPSPTISKPMEKTATLTFSPEVYTVSSFASASGSVDIILNSGDHPVTGVQLEMQYDPTVFTTVSFATPSSSIWDQTGIAAVEKLKNINQNEGRISYLSEVESNGKTITGIGPVISLNFRVNPAFLTSTTINLLEKSLVRQEGSIESALNTRGTFTIISILPTQSQSTPSANIQISPTP